MTDHAALESAINSAWEARAEFSTATKGEARDAVTEALELIDKGELRAASPNAGTSPMGMLEPSDS